MAVQHDNQFKSRSYFVASGWKEFLRDTDMSEGDICVFKFIRSEDKICLAKITKKKTPARPLPPAIEPPVTEVERVDDGDDGDLFFVATIIHKFRLVRFNLQLVCIRFHLKRFIAFFFKTGRYIFYIQNY